MSHPDDHFHFGCFPRPSRRSPNVAGNNNSANPNHSTRRGLFSMGQGGRTVLPPLHLPFRASRSPAPDQFPTNQYAHDPSQGRTDYNVAGYNQSGWPNAAPQQAQAGQFPADPRYQAQNPNYASYQSRTPSAIPSGPLDSRTLPPLGSQQGQYYPQTGVPSQSMAAAPHIRSQSAAGYGGQYNAYSVGQVPPQAPFYGNPPDPRMVTSPVSATQYDPASGAPLPRRTSMSVDRTVPSRPTHGLPPYARPQPSLASEYDREPVPEPTIKKKRKRADAEQLKVLNETYNRTAFPSTEERIDLAKKLGMSARSVQIWFQNKRQAMRQSSRQASSAVPPPATEPFTAGPAPGAAPSVTSPAPQQPQGAGPYGGMGSMGSISMAAYGGSRVDQYGRPTIPSPPSSQYRGRSYDEHERRSPSRTR
ncbi:hypothetical protein PHLGIDRAFT_184498 [Phlebiopsis gigantea 11061_1 CR5-6]|uniref:Homeobox domain-containing protein n=1 Tax=Phlebiopsis gigantea (strain 11061_1 CR5-6) TaxID=745531 RepID=A0A0C3SET1_PHLG1|nr:hypothetical protein PHLGIDRAFT_184498 [Phlebiopsis gigantea 11061_1 CR5-6]